MLTHIRSMTPQLVFATNNLHKIKEVSFMLGGKVELLSLNNINCSVDIPETAATLEGNALLKARYVYENYGLNCFADDTGLEVEVLNNEPGVYSARYAGEEKDSQANMQKLLQKLEGKENRKACFRTVIALILYEKEHLFEGIVHGEIIKERQGNFGFGYDPVFVPEGYVKTYAELGNDVKNAISHRAMAINKLCEFLSSQTRDAKCMIETK
jgi:XTP/dITP diphosphohydrolase